MANQLDDLADISFEWTSDDATMSTIDLSGFTASGTCPTTMASTYSSYPSSGNVTITTSSIGTGTITSSNPYISNTGNLGIGAVGSPTSGGYVIGTGNGWNGTFASNQPKLAIDAKEDGVFFKTDKHNVNWDELVDDIKSIKHAFILMYQNEELMKAHPEIQDMLSDWLIKGLSK